MFPWAEHQAFVKTWLANPKQVGSLIPSSRRLAAAMADTVPWGNVRTVVELGAGTGAITARILEQKPPDTRFLVFERDRGFRQILLARFPTVTVFSEAKGLSTILWGSGIRTADAIVSGIPFALLTHVDRESLLDEIERALSPGGHFVAFQYWPQMYSALKRRFAIVRLSVVWANFPPAVVYQCTKAGRIEP